MGYTIIGLIGFSLGFVAGLTFGLSSEKVPAEARSQGTNPEEENTDRASADPIGDNNE